MFNPTRWLPASLEALRDGSAHGAKYYRLGGDAKMMRHYKDKTQDTKKRDTHKKKEPRK